MVLSVLPLPPNTFQVSFDVEPLFTNIPVDLWDRIACDCLRNDSSLTDSSLLLCKEVQTLLSDHAGVVCQVSCVSEQWIYGLKQLLHLCVIMMRANPANATTYY